jgi:hypothetical protein
MSDWRIEHLEPWSAAGPGWANRGITAYMVGPAYQDKDGLVSEKKKTITVYDKDLNAEESLALSVALRVRGALEQAVMRSHKKGSQQ